MNATTVGIANAAPPGHFAALTHTHLTHSSDLVSIWESRYLAEHLEKATGSVEPLTAIKWTRVETGILEGVRQWLLFV